MRFLQPLLTSILIGAGASAIVAHASAQTCACPPPEQGMIAPNAEPYGSGGEAASGRVVPMIVADEPPPPIPEYDQPPPPGPDYYWTPGYWAWNNVDYYWTPGVWVQPPRPGLLWTPGYWAFNDGVYVYRGGYWGHRVGFYGGVNYGYGYFGHGYEGGRWDGDRFFYNAAVNNFGGAAPPNVYHAPVTVGGTVVNNFAALAALSALNRTSFVGGPGGVRAAPTPQERQAAQEQRLPPTPLQRQQLRAAAVDPQQFLDVNRGRPPIAATARPGDFKGPGVMPARAPGGPIPPPAANGQPLPPDRFRPGLTTLPGQPVTLPQPLPQANLPSGVKPAFPAQPGGSQPMPGAPRPTGQPQPPDKPLPGLKPPSPGQPAASQEPAAGPTGPNRQPLPQGKSLPGEKRPSPTSSGSQGIRPTQNKEVVNPLPRAPGAQPVEGVNPPPGPAAAQARPPGLPPAAQMLAKPQTPNSATAPHPAQIAPHAAQPGGAGGPPRCGLPGMPPCPH